MSLVFFKWFDDWFLIMASTDHPQQSEATRFLAWVDEKPKWKLPLI